MSARDKIKMLREDLGNTMNPALRPCLNVEIESVHRICLVTDSVDRFYIGSKRPYWEMLLRRVKQGFHNRTHA